MEKKLNATVMLSTLMVTLFVFASAAKPVNANEVIPYLEVKPSCYKTCIMETFDVTVWLHNITAGKKLSGIEFRLLYKDTLLEVVDVTEGPFLPSFPNRPDPPYTIFTWVNDSMIDVYGPNLYIVNALIPNGTANPPEGSGEIARITFRGIYPQGNSTLELEEIVMIDDQSIPITNDPPRNGYYEIFSFELLDLNDDNRIDIKDVVLLAKNFGSVLGDPGYNKKFDINCNGIIDVWDLAIVSKCFGKRI